MSKRPASPIGKAVRVTIVHKRLRDLLDYEDNPRIHPEKGTPEWDRLRSSLTFDYFDPLVWNERNRKLVSGHLRKKMLLDLGVESADVVRVKYDEATHRSRVVAANEQAGAWDDTKLRVFLQQMVGGEIPAELSGLTDERIRALLEDSADEGDGAPSVNPKLHERFGVPPFSILDARQGYWQERKRAWLALGIQSEVGRGDNLLKFSNTVLQPDKGKRLAKTFGTEGNVAGEWTGTSIFDPVLCELAYRWFCGPGGEILDPFAGGSVRGVVAAWLGRNYTGIDLRGEQVAANREQWDRIRELAKAPARPNFKPITNRDQFTPVEESVEGFFFKRDDYFEFGGANGGKVRAMLKLAVHAKGIVTCGDRTSTQLPRAAMVAKALGLPCRVHTASGIPTDGMIEATAHGAEVIQHDPGYLTVCKKRAKEDAEAHGYLYIPWGLEHPDAVMVLVNHVASIKKTKAKRLVVPVGSGMTLAGILTGMVHHKIKLPVLGILLGGDAEKRLDEYAPKGWRKMVKLVKANQPFHSEAPQADRTFKGVSLDPVYEAKCVPFLKPGDMLWIVGRRTESRPPIEVGKPKWLEGDSRDVHKLAKGAQFDFIFSCPPYFDLEVYSDKATDLSRAESYELFVRDYRKIISGACAQLRDNRFACFVVGDIRDKRGNYRNFVADTIAAFRDAGLELYNDGILITSVGSLALRVGKQFVSSRKMGKAHQNVLVFVKGDARKATEHMGPVEFGDIETSGFAEAPEVESPAA